MAYNPYAGTLPTYQTGGAQGGAPTSGSGTPYGMVPNLPPYTTDTTQVIGTNAYPQLQAILGAGYQGGLNQEMGNIGNLLKGMIPSDVMANLGVAGAERGIATGSYGSPNANSAMMRALGLTSLGLQQQGIDNLSKVIGQVPIQQNQTTTQTTDLGAARAGYAAAPDPRLAAEQALANAKAGIGAGMGSVSMPSPAAAMTGSPAAYQNPYASGYSDQNYRPQSAWSTPSTNPFIVQGNTVGGEADSWDNPVWQDTWGMPSGVGETAYPSQANMWGDMWSGEGMIGDYGTGYQPTSQGSMYMGNLSGYEGGQNTGAGTYYAGPNPSAPADPFAGMSDEDYFNYLYGGG